MRSSTSLLIGVTGGIGSGKSVVCEIFRILGAPVYDADSRAKFLQNNDPQLSREIIGLLGKEAYVDNKLNNKWIASSVFKDPDLLKNLNKLVHPRVAQDFADWRNKNKNSPYLVKEAALLFEAGSYKQLDKLVVVTAPEELRIKRVLSRDSHRTEEQVKNIIKMQWPEDRKTALADFVINNDERELVLPQVLDLHKRFAGF